MKSGPMTAGADAVPGRRRLWAEVLIVLGLSLGASAAYAIVNLLDLLTRPTAISQQTATLNTSQSSRPTFDLIYQLMGIFFALVPAMLVCFLLWQVARPHLGRLGIDLARPARDSVWGLALAIIIGAGGIGVYLGGRALGITVNVVPTALDTYWWTVPVLILSAVRAALQEEVVVIGYLFARLRDLGWGKWQIIVSTSVLRGSYHLYQGVGAFFGNFVMGMLFGWLYARYGRLLPFVIAHALIDAAIFVGYPWAASAFPGLFAAAN
jgi:membrane protease YdiL (CAAX protease family)